MASTNFFSQFSKDAIKHQYRENLKGLQQMLDKAIRTGKRVNGYTKEQLQQMVDKFKTLSNS